MNPSSHYSASELNNNTDAFSRYKRRLSASANFPHFLSRATAPYIAMRVGFAIVISLGLFLLSAIKISAQIPDKAPKYAPITLKEAENWCDTFTIKNPEGIYWYPSAKAIVLIRRTDSSRLGTAPYEIVSLESSNLLYPPGQTIGYLSPTGNPKKFTLTVYSDLRPEELSKPKHYSADYNSSLAAFTYHKPQRRITFNPMYLLPRIFRAFRIDSKNSNSIPEESLRRIYPKVLTSPNSSLQLPLYF